MQLLMIAFLSREAIQCASLPSILFRSSSGTDASAVVSFVFLAWVWGPVARLHASPECCDPLLRDAFGHVASPAVYTKTARVDTSVSDS